VARLVGAAMDITSLKDAERSLRDADRRKTEFLGMLSHELRNPLAPIRHSIYLLERSNSASDRARRARAVLARQSEHLARLVDDLLDVTRIARGKIELRRVPMDLSEVVRRTAEDLRSVLEEHELALAVDLRAGTWIHGDPTRLGQVVGNLLQNAAKFTPAGGRVTLSLATAGDAAEIRVHDTGIGIPPELLDHIFEPFVQAERSLARTQGGLGLGLALVKGIAEMHGGAVRVASAGTGAGAEFIVSLPLSVAPREVSAPQHDAGLAR
jgi:signal transduction histidine kinase